MENERLDIQLYRELTDHQCDIAIAIWRKLGVFDTNEAVAIASKTLREENVWAKTFYNYSYTELNNRDANRMKRFTNQIIDRARDIYKNFGVVIRHTHRSNNESHNYICKMSSNAALTQHSRRVGSAATNLVTASAIDESFPEKQLSTMKQLVSRVETKVPDLVKRLKLLSDMEQAIVNKKREVYGLLDNMNGGIAGQIEAATPSAEVQADLDKMNPDNKVDDGFDYTKFEIPDKEDLNIVEAEPVFDLNEPVEEKKNLFDD